MLKMFYTYDQIQNIRNDLYNLVSILEKPGSPASSEDVRGLKSELYNYDILLRNLGRGNICRDPELCRAFDKTKSLINHIKLRIGII